MVELQALNIAASRVQHRRHAAQLLRLVRRSRADGTLHIHEADDTFHLALWRLGAFERTAFATVWLETPSGRPVVRDPETLAYYTVDLRDPLGVPTPYDFHIRRVQYNGEILTVQ